MSLDVRITIQEHTDVASARRECMEVARGSGLESNEVANAGIVVSEASTNLLKHAGGGEVIVRKFSRDSSRAIEIIASDRGRGMADPIACFADGYSTAGSAGTGLGAIARLSFFHQVYSLPGSGTVLVAQVGKAPREAARVEIGGISLPYPGESACGDAWTAETSGSHCRVSVADGLGHGIFASEAANAAVAEVTDAYAPSQGALMQMMHNKLRSGRGAAVAIADIDFINGSVGYTGVGNITGCIVEALAPRRQMLSMNGTVGHEMRKVQSHSYPLPARALVVLHSDGLTANWSLEKYPGLMSRDNTLIAAVLLRDFRRLRDDATVVVIRQGADA